jgi:Ni2+-binding GTPase involved in maturation of urease and hydrogenase
MGEDSVKNQDQQGYRSLWEMPQTPVRDTVRARSLADPETPDGFLDLLMVVNVGSLADAMKYDLSPTLTVSITAGTEGSVTG